MFPTHLSPNLTQRLPFPTKYNVYIKGHTYAIYTTHTMTSKYNITKRISQNKCEVYKTGHTVCNVYTN